MQQIIVSKTHVVTHISTKTRKHIKTPQHYKSLLTYSYTRVHIPEYISYINQYSKINPIMATTVELLTQREPNTPRSSSRLFLRGGSTPLQQHWRCSLGGRRAPPGSKGTLALVSAPGVTLNPSATGATQNPSAPDATENPSASGATQNPSAPGANYNPSAPGAT